MNAPTTIRSASRAGIARWAIGLVAAIASFSSSARAGDIWVWGGSIVTDRTGGINAPWTCVKSAVIRAASHDTVHISGGAYGGGHDRNLRITTPMRLTTYAANANAARIPASIGKRATFSNSQKLALIQRYAPYIWFSYGQDDVPERFWPSSVEWAFNYRTNFPPNMRNGLERWQNRENDGGNWWLRTQFDIDPATGEWPLFYGDLASSRIYAFWREKNSIADERTPVFDLVYFMFFPYNRGKEVAGSVYGNHVGDWEHVTVRTFGGVAAAIHSEAHGGSGTNRNWNIQPKHPGTDYPVVYCAWGSHGFYLDAGIYNYGPWPELIDICLPYGSWASGNPVSRIEAFDFNAHARLGDPRPYPRWLDTDYTSAGDCDPYFPGGGPDPSCASGGGPITHWGNEGKSAGLLADGPTGPADKNALKNENVFE